LDIKVQSVSGWVVVVVVVVVVMLVGGRWMNA
jgi:hypothetical protein